MGSRHRTVPRSFPQASQKVVLFSRESDCKLCLTLFFLADLHGKTPLINWCLLPPIYSKNLRYLFCENLREYFSERDQRRKLQAKIRLRLFPCPISITR